MKDNTTAGKNPSACGKTITIDEGEVKGNLNTAVKDVVEETLNGMLDAEADELCKASKYERSPERLSARAGHYTKTPHAVAGGLKLKIPRLRSIPVRDCNNRALQAPRSVRWGIAYRNVHS